MNRVTRRRNRPEDEPCPDNACPHPSRLHDERIRSVGQAPCSTCSACAEDDAEDEAEYDHSRAKEDARNAMFREDLGDDAECGHCGYPVRHGSGAAVTCDVCGPFCCEDHHRRHPAYSSHDLGVARSVSSVPAAQAASDAAALDSIAHMLRDPDWGVGMLEDIGEIVTATGRSIANLPGDEPTWTATDGSTIPLHDLRPTGHGARRRDRRALGRR